MNYVIEFISLSLERIMNYFVTLQKINVYNLLYFMKKLTILTVAALFGVNTLCAQEHNPIKVNQVGYYPNQEKTAAVEKDAEAKIYTLTDKKGKVVWKGKGARKAVSPWSAKEREIVDFSSVKTPGEYTLKAGKISQKVIIKEHALNDLAIASLKAFYLQRTGEPILEKYVGKYARPAAHMDTNVLVHPSAASEGRPAGTVISSPGGWYDAGDFNKYIVNSAYTIAVMLDSYEMNKAYFDKLEVNIPESGNGTADLLDEIMVNLKWMQTMQDPGDGGVYHKLTTPNFEGFIMPSECKQQRYVVQKTTAAALDFAAVMAKAARIYGKMPQYREWAKTATAQAEKAYEWAQKNPNIYYRQNEMNKKFDPDVNTGAYDDNNLKDEKLWATVELILTTGDMNLVQSIRMDEITNLQFSIPTWGSVLGLAAYSVIAAADDSSTLLGQYRNESMVSDMIDKVTDLIKSSADKWIATVPTSCYNSPYGNVASDFHWGCLAEGCAGKGIAFLYAYRLTGDKKYLTAAIENMDYILGRNATGYCYVTGFGQTPTMHPHQRLSAADGIEDPLPGFLAGGPNPGQQDKAPNLPAYPSNHPDESYLDHDASYASNEIAINWNATLVALAGWLEAEM